MNNMYEKVLTNLDKIDKNRYNEISILLSEEKNINNYFNEEIKKIMNEWSSNHIEFKIPNILVCINVNDANYYFSNTNILKNDTIFDIASITKLYTEMMLFEILEEYNLSLDTKISDITNIYQKIGKLTLLDLISFNNTYKTEFDIRECKDQRNALNALRTVYIEEEKTGQYLYTDLPIMILTDILENITKMNYKSLFEKYIIKKYNLKETFLETNSNKYLTNNKYYVNDPKANIMGGFYGHCGVKATCSDLNKFLNIVLNNKKIDLFTSISKTVDATGNIKKNKALIGNANLSVIDDDSLASIYLPKIGFAVQGSVRCHAEACTFIIDGKKYNVTSCIFTDLYTQIENIKKYEKNNNIKITKELNINNKKMIMCDIRNVFSYKDSYKEVVNLVGKIRTYLLFRYLNDK